MTRVMLSILVAELVFLLGGVMHINMTVAFWTGAICGLGNMATLYLEL